MRNRRKLISLMVIALACAPGCGANQLPITVEKRKTVTIDVTDIELIQDQPLLLERVIHPGDRILFIGDELTQQRLYTRATAAALLVIMPDADLRFFNGGYSDATTETAAAWIDDLLELSRPTVVFVCFGLNDAARPGATTQKVEQYKKSLSALIDRTRQSNPTNPPRVVVLSAPAVAPITMPSRHATPDNDTLRAFALAARQTAFDKNAMCADLMAPMQRAYTAVARSQNQIGNSDGEAAASPSIRMMLTRDGRLPDEQGHVVLASMVLYGIGVSGRQLDLAGWSPLPAVRMGSIRGLLGLPVKVPTSAQARRSQQLYEGMRTFDQLFFDAWRLAPYRPNGATRAELMQKADNEWAAVRRLARTDLAAAGPDREK